MIKNIYILWFQGFNKAPEIVKECIHSWKHYNPDWNIILLDDNNLSEYIQLDNYITDIYKKSIEKCHLSDIIRCLLLTLYGGLWVDATTFCNRPLNDWLPNYIKDGFFAFDKPVPDRLISNWFLYSEINNYIIDKWCHSTLNYYTIHNKAHTYYIHHYLFGDLYSSDITFKETWDKVPKLSASGPHYLQHNWMFKYITNEIKRDIDAKITPLYKLTYKFDISNKKSSVYYLYSTINKSFK